MIYFNDDRSICQKCTLCAHRLEKGKEPACIEACPSRVFLFGEESKVVAEAKKQGAKLMHPEYKTGPKIYYIGLPSVSLAGHLIDSKTLMDVPGATITLKDAKKSTAVKTRSNIAGNFLVEDLKMSNAYTVKIECRDYIPKINKNVHLDIDYKHLSDVKLQKET